MRSFWVSFIWPRISSSRENFSASRSREAFSGSRLASASDSRNIRSSSSVIWAETFSCVNPIVSRSETAGAFGVPAAASFVSSAFFSSFASSSKTSAALPGSAFFCSCAEAPRG